VRRTSQVLGKVVERLRSTAGSVWKTVASAVVCVLVLFGCTSQPLRVTHEPVTLRMVSIGCCEAVADSLIQTYEAQHPWVSIKAEAADDDLVRSKLESGEADIALMTEEDQTPAGAWWEAVWNRDGIAIVANPTLPITEVDVSFLHEVYRGRIQEWEGTVLAVVTRDSGSGIRNAFDDLVLGDQTVTLTAVVMPSDRDVIEFVAGHLGAIGYVSTFRLAPEDLERVRVLPVGGALPTQSAVADGSYPLSRQLVIATRGEPAGELREFAQWLVSPAGCTLSNKSFVR